MLVKTKRLLSLIICLAMIFSMLPLSAFAATAEHAISITNKPGSSFELTHDDTYEVYDLWNEIDSEATEDPWVGFAD